MENSKVFKLGTSYLLVEVIDDKVVVKTKQNGWNDTWSLPLVECDSFGRIEPNTLTRLWEEAK